MAGHETRCAKAKADLSAHPRGTGAVTPAGACDFFFSGSAILPPFLFYIGEPALAAIAVVFLVIAGAVCGIGDPQAPHRATETLPGHRE